MSQLSAEHVIKSLEAIASDERIPDTARFFYDGLGETKVLGIQIGNIFPIAKSNSMLPLDEINILLDSCYYEVRMAGVAIMDFQARRKNPDLLRQLYELYLERHDRINNWDLVDRAAAHVVSQYLEARSREPLYELARSPDPWRRRTAIVATWWFIRQGDVSDIFRLSEVLADDRHPMIEKALGSWLRAAGDVDRERLRAFLQSHRDRLSATTLRMATEKWTRDERAAIRDT